MLPTRFTLGYGLAPSHTLRQHLAEQVRPWRYTLPNELRAVTLRQEDLRAIFHSALDDVDPIGLGIVEVLARLVPAAATKDGVRFEYGRKVTI